MNTAKTEVNNANQEQCNAENEFFDKETSDKLFDIAAQNMGYKNLQELLEVQSWLEKPKIDPDKLDEDVTYIATPKPEFKEKYEAWLEERRRRPAAIQDEPEDAGS